jgi:tetratricopeptide (TPR) repeat protein
LLPPDFAFTRIHSASIRHPNLAEDFINLAAIEYERADYKAAEQLDRQALAIMQSFYSKNHPETASVMTLAARALVAEGQLSEAADMLRDVLGGRNRFTKSPGHPELLRAESEDHSKGWMKHKPSSTLQ